MNEGIGGVILGVVGILGLTYLGVRIRQNQRRLRKMVGVVDDRHSMEVEYLFGLADSGQLRTYGGSVSA